MTMTRLKKILNLLPWLIPIGFGALILWALTYASYQAFGIPTPDWLQP